RSLHDALPIYHVRALLSDRASPLAVSADGIQSRLGGLATAALELDVLLARLGDATHDLDVVFRLRELLDQLSGLLTKSLVDHAELTEVPVRFVTLACLLVELPR